MRHIKLPQYNILKIFIRTFFIDRRMKSHFLEKTENIYILYNIGYKLWSFRCYSLRNCFFSLTKNVKLNAMQKVLTFQKKYITHGNNKISGLAFQNVSMARELRLI